MKKKIVSIHQPNFIPWLGFFDKIAKSDILVIYDTCAVGKNSVFNRNKVKTPQGPIWLTVPTHATLAQPINEIEIDNSSSWQEKHLKTLFFNYKKAKFYDEIYPEIEKIYSRSHQLLNDLNMDFINFLTKQLKIKKEIVFASGLKVSGSQNEALIDMVKKVHGDVYLSGDGSHDYLDTKLFEDKGIEVIWQNYEAGKYHQLWGDFIPNLSVVDYLFCDKGAIDFANSSSKQKKVN